MNAHDEKLLAAVRAFNPYDLYSKSDAPCDPVALRPYYEGLIRKFFPDTVEWWIWWIICIVILEEDLACVHYI